MATTPIPEDRNLLTGSPVQDELNIGGTSAVRSEEAPAQATPFYEKRVEGPGFGKSTLRGLDSEFGRGVVRRFAHTMDGKNKVGGGLATAHKATWSATKSLYTTVIPHIWKFETQSMSAEEPKNFEDYCAENNIKGVEKGTLKTFLVIKRIVGSPLASVIAAAAGAVTAVVTGAIIGVKTIVALLWALRTPIILTGITVGLIFAAPFIATGGIATGGFLASVSPVAWGFIGLGVALAATNVIWAVANRKRANENKAMSAAMAARAEEQAREALLDDPTKARIEFNRLVDFFINKPREEEERSDYSLAMTEAITGSNLVALKATIENAEQNLKELQALAEGIEVKLVRVVKKMEAAQADGAQSEAATHSEKAGRLKTLLIDITGAIAQLTPDIARDRAFADSTEEDGAAAVFAERKAQKAQAEKARLADEAAAASELSRREREANPPRTLMQRLRGQPATEPSPFGNAHSGRPVVERASRRPKETEEGGGDLFVVEPSGESRTSATGFHDAL